MLRFFEESRMRALLRAGAEEEAPGTAVFDTATGVQLLIVRQEVEYTAPVPYRRNPLEVELWFGRIGGSSVQVCHELYSGPEGDGQPARVLYASSTAVIVKIDIATGTPVALSAYEHDALSPYQGDAIAYRDQQQSMR